MWLQICNKDNFQMMETSCVYVKMKFIDTLLSPKKAHGPKAIFVHGAHPKPFFQQINQTTYFNALMDYVRLWGSSIIKELTISSSNIQKHEKRFWTMRPTLGESLYLFLDLSPHPSLIIFGLSIYCRTQSSLTCTGSQGSFSFS